MTTRVFRAVLRALRGFITIPAAISLSGLALALGVWSLEAWIEAARPSLVPGFLAVDVETARAVLSTVAGAAMSALVMVYSIVLLVFTMAASAIGPRLLLRFGDDRVNQISVGSLGATFLYCVTCLWLIGEDAAPRLTVAGGLAFAVVSVLLLLLFVERVSRQITIDAEAAGIARTLDRQVARAIGLSASLSPSDVVLPEGPERDIRAGEGGYIDFLDASALVGAAGRAGAVVVFHVRPGDFVIEQDRLATVIGDPGGALDRAIQAAVPRTTVRNPEGDLRFSVNLLVEIALRALSPGVNDTFTAIACTDRLSATIAKAREDGLSVGVFCDAAGVVRVISPPTDADSLFREAFSPLRRAARGNVLMIEAIHGALARMLACAQPDGAEALLHELRLLRAELDAADILAADRDALGEKIDATLARLPGGQRPAGYGGQNPSPPD